jgi:hypothetical protein
MERAFERYLKSIHQQFEYHATWAPNEHRTLGEIGTFDRGVFKHVSSLQNEGLTFRERSDGIDANFEHSSGMTYSSDSRATGAIAAGLKSRATLDFSGGGAFAFVAQRCTITTIDDQNLLGREILLAHKNGTWDPDWVFIDTLVTAASATILVSGSDSAKLELMAEAPISAGLVGLADMSGDFNIASTSGQITKILASRQITPMFRLSQIRRRLLGARMEAVRTLHPSGATAENDEPLESVPSPWG